MPDICAVRTARAVGAETATMNGEPMAAAFCTISTDTREVTITAPLPPSMPALASAPASLSSAL